MTPLGIESWLEAEERGTLGRSHYKHSSEPGRGYRNGLREGRLKAAEACDQSGLLQKLFIRRLQRIFGRKGKFRRSMREGTKLDDKVSTYCIHW
jgi:hypothetical protein